MTRGNTNLVKLTPAELKRQALEQAEKKVAVWRQRVADAEDVLADAQTRLAYSERLLEKAQSMADR